MSLGFTALKIGSTLNQTGQDVVLSVGLQQFCRNKSWVRLETCSRIRRILARCSLAAPISGEPIKARVPRGFRARLS